MWRTAWLLLKQTVYEFIEDNALSRGAAIAYYTITSLGPVLLIIVALVGVVLGRSAAQGAVFDELVGLLGQQGADTVQSMILSADRTGASLRATIIGVVTLILTASGVFGEMQSSLNAIWKADPSRYGTVTRLLRARAAGLFLVMGLGFLMLASLLVGAAIAAVGDYLNMFVPDIQMVVTVANTTLSFVLVSAMFAAIYRVLPDKVITWRDVGIGAVVTAALFELGRFLIGLYISHGNVASSYGAAGALIVVLIFIYYSAQIFLFGAEFTKVFAQTYGSQVPRAPAPDTSSHPELARLQTALAETTRR